MKKTLLLSVVASTMIMAGGDIAPVEPVVEAPAVVSGWNFSGNAVLYYQTDDAGGAELVGSALEGSDFMYLSGNGSDDSLFAQGSSAADLGIQLRATNNDVVAGIGAGVEVSGLATLGLEHWMVSNVMQSDAGNLTGGWISQLYLTYGMGNTSFKAGRQELPKALSPFAYSEDWNVFKNTFDALLVVNTDLPNTTLVGAYVYRWNVNGMHADMSDFDNKNGQDGVYMLTVQNTSIENLTLTGSIYYADSYAANNGIVAVSDETMILWADAQYAANSFTIGLQGGNIDVGVTGANDTTAFGAKVSTTVSDINLMAAYSNVDDGYTGMFQVGGSTSALYTNTVLNQLAANTLEMDADKFVVSASMAALGGNIAAVYAYTDSAVTDTTNELDLVYSTNLTDDLSLTAAYVYADADALNDSVDVVRVVANYKF